MLKGMLKTFEDIMYSERFLANNGFLQSVDPRVKLLCFVAFILTAVASRNLTSLVALLAIIIILSHASKVPTKFFLLRTLIFIPLFAAAIAAPLPFITPGRSIATLSYSGYTIYVTEEGVYIAANFTFRIWICVASLTLLILTTRFFRFLHTLERFKVPKILIAVTTITYRFIFLFINEAYRMVLAKEARTVNRESRLRILRSLARMVSTLFIRAYERGERVYMAMMARGYRGEMRSMGEMKCYSRDLFFGAAAILFCIAVLFVEFYL